MAITRPNATTYNESASATSITVNKPTVEVGDVMIASGTAASTTALTFSGSGGGGWTEIAVLGDSSTVSIGMWLRVVTGSEASSWDFGQSTAGRLSGQITAYRGVDTSTPQDATAVTAGPTTATSLTHAGITTQTNGAMVVGCGGVNSSTQASGGTKPTEMTLLWGNTDSVGKWHRAAEESRSSSGATGSRVWGSGSSLARVAIHAALRPVTAHLVDVGQASETDTAQAVARARAYAAGQASHGNIAQAVTVSRGRSFAVGQTTEPNTAQAVTRSAVAVGQTTEADTAPTATVIQWNQTDYALAITAQLTEPGGEVAVAATTETDTAQTVARSKASPAGESSDTELAQPVAHAKTTPVAQVTEIDTSQAVARSKASPAGQAADSEISQPTTVRLGAAVGQVVETEISQPIVVSRAYAVGQGSETDTAPAAVADRSRTIEPADETDYSGPLNHVDKFHAVEQVTDTQTAVTILNTAGNAVHQASETDVAQAVVASKYEPPHNFALPITVEMTPPSVQNIDVYPASEIDTAQPAGHALASSIDQAEEPDTAQAVSSAKATPAGQVTETDTAQEIQAAKRTAVGQSSETDTAPAAVGVRGRAVGQVTETDTAQAVTRSAVAVGQTTEPESAQAVTSAKRTPVGQATETDGGQPITVTFGRNVGAGQASHGNTSQPITSTKTVAVGNADETDSAQSITVRQPKQVNVGTAADTQAAQHIAAQVPLATVLVWTDAQPDTSGEETNWYDCMDAMQSLDHNLNAAMGDYTSSWTSGQQTVLDTGFDVGDFPTKFHGASGNHDRDYGWPGTWTYFDNESSGSMGPSSSAPYHSVNLNGWHLIFLEINDGSGCPSYASGSTQYNWLHTDLDDNSAKPTLVFFHYGRYNNTDRYGDNTGADDVWELLLQHSQVEAVFGGHIHVYERFARMNGSGGVDATNGIRQFNVPSCGAAGNGTQQEGSQTGAQAWDTHAPPLPGFMRLRLYADRYSWEVLVPSGYTEIKTDHDYGQQTIRVPLTQHDINVDRAGETDSAGGVGRARAYALGRADETDTAQHAAATRFVPVGQASETDGSQQVAPSKTATVGQSAETEISQSTAAAKFTALGAAAETDVAQQTGAARFVTSGQAAETDAATSLSVVRTIPVGAATEEDTAPAVTFTQYKVTNHALQITPELTPATPTIYADVYPAAETDAAAEITPAITGRYFAVEQSAETDAAQPVTQARAYAVGLVTETDTAQPVTQARAYAIGQALETDTAQDVGQAYGHAAGQAAETDTAQAIAQARAYAVGEATESSTAQAIATGRGYAAGQATETDTAQPVTQARAYAVAEISETDVAQSVTPTITHRFVPVGIAAETDTAGLLSFAGLKNVPAGQTVEPDTAQHIASSKATAVGPASDTQTALGADSIHSRISGQPTETDTARGVTPTITHRWIQVGQASETDSAQDAAATITHHWVAVQPPAESDTASPLSMSGRKYIAAGRANSTESAQAVSVRKSKVLGQSSTVESVTVIAKTKRRGLSTAASTHAAQQIRATKTPTVGMVLETELARAFVAAHIIPVGSALELDIATVMGGQAPPINVYEPRMVLTSALGRGVLRSNQTSAMIDTNHARAQIGENDAQGIVAENEVGVTTI